MLLNNGLLPMLNWPFPAIINGGLFDAVTFKVYLAVSIMFLSFSVLCLLVFVIGRPKSLLPMTPERAEQISHSANISLAVHSRGSAQSEDIQNGHRRTRDMQQAEIPEIATTPMPVFVTSGVRLSIVVPVMNEQRNVRPLYEKLSAKLNQLGNSYEIIFVDDGSTDHTFVELQKLHYEHPNSVHVIRFRKNFGKTPALVAGFSRSRGDVVFTMDGDLQDDPAEIPRFLAKLDEGYDLVTGWKFPRLDPLTKTFPSRIFNALVSRLTGLHLHDINCGFKAYRREVLEDIHLKLYGEFHTVCFLTSSLHTPLRLFGKLGFWTFLLGNIVDVFVVVRSFITQKPIHNQPLLFVGMLLIIFGFQFILIGLLGEMIRHYAFQPGEEYSVRQELALRDDYHAHDAVVPAEVHRQQGPLQVEGELLYPQSSQDLGQQQQPLWDKHNGSHHHTRGRNIPHRPTIIPL